jgi:hypothetical protein
MLICSRRHLHHLGQCRRPPPLLHGTDAGKGSRGGPWYCAIRATPSLPTQTGPAPPREDATRTRAGVRVAAARARHAGAGPHAGRGPHARRHGAAASPGEGWGARGRAEGARGEGRAEFDSRRAYGTHSRNPCTSAAIIPPPLPASRLEGGSTSAGVGARRALGIVAAIWGRRGMVWARHRGYQPSPSRKVITIPVKIIYAHGRGKSG